MSTFDSYLMRLLTAVTALLGTYCLGWAVLLLAMQALGWLKAGDWQPVPLFALFVSEPSQDAFRYYNSFPQPLSAVPAWDVSQDAQALSARLAGSLLGMQKILSWALEAALTGWLLFAAFVFFFASNMAYSQVLEHSQEHPRVA